MSQTAEYKLKRQGYNERLFEGKNFRSKLHLARYFWLQDIVGHYLKDQQNLSVLELGCYDGKAINFIPKPAKYVGYDANWEKGLELARDNWRDHPEYTFHECHSLKDFNPPPKAFDISICMETLEHLPPDEMEGYLAKLAAATKSYSFISVPNEKGLFFGVKYLARAIMVKDPLEKYTLKEYFYTVLGKTDKVKRNEHKGFNYEKLLITASNYFIIEKVSGIGISRFLPAWLNTNVAIVLKPL